MSTVKQQKLAKKLIQNASEVDPLNTTELLESVGYAHKTALHNPQVVMQSKGLKQELKVLGFDEETAKQVVSEILSSDYEEARDRLKAAEMVFKVFGSFAPEKRLNVNVDMEENPIIHELTEKINAEYRQKSLEGGQNGVGQTDASKP